MSRARRYYGDARWNLRRIETHPCGPLPAGIGPTEARLQELLLAGGHSCPLAEAARVVEQDRAASGTDRPVPAGQWSDGTPVTPRTARERETGFRHAETAGRS